jgi:hypothetical protein
MSSGSWQTFVQQFVLPDRGIAADPRIRRWALGLRSWGAPWSAATLLLKLLHGLHELLLALLLLHLLLELRHVDTEQRPGGLVHEFGFGLTQEVL